MKSFGLSTVVTAVSLLTLSGCATYSAIDEQELPKSGWAIELDVSQHEVAVKASDQANAMAAGGGLIGALVGSAVDKHRNQKAEDAVTELRDLLIEYPFSSRFEQMLVESRVLDSLAVDGQVEVLTQPRPDYKINPLAGETFLVRPRVEFTNDLSNLNVMLLVAGQVPDAKGRPSPRGFYQFYKYVIPLAEPESGKAREDYAAVWVGYGKDQLAAMIEAGMRVAIEMVRADAREGMLALTETRIKVANLSGPIPQLFVVGGDEETVWARSKQRLLPTFAFPADKVEYR